MCYIDGQKNKYSLYMKFIIHQVVDLDHKNLNFFSVIPFYLQSVPVK
jgi:hypothetical protein